MERKVCFILDASSQWGRWTPVPRPFPHPPDTQWARASVGRGRGLRADRAQSALTVILKLVIGGLTSIILNVLGTVNLQFQGPFVSISLWSVLGIVEAHVLGTVWSSCS